MKNNEFESYEDFIENFCGLLANQTKELYDELQTQLKNHKLSKDVYDKYMEEDADIQDVMTRIRKRNEPYTKDLDELFEMYCKNIDILKQMYEASHKHVDKPNLKGKGADEKIKIFENAIDEFKSHSDEKYYSNIVIETMISFFNDEALQMHGPADITDAIKGKWQAEINRRRPRRPITDDVNVPLQIILIIIFAGIIMFVNTPGPHAFIAAHFKDALTVVAAILTIIGFFIISFWVIPVLVLIVWGAVALWDLLGEGLQTMISAHGGAALISILLGVLAFKCLLKIVKRGSGKKEMKLYNAENARYLEWSSSTKTKLNSYVATISTLYPEAAASYKKGFDKIPNYEESKERMIQQFGKFKSTLVGAYNEVIKML